MMSRKRRKDNSNKRSLNNKKK